MRNRKEIQKDAGIFVGDAVATVHHLANWTSPEKIYSSCEYIVRPDQFQGVLDQLNLASSEPAWAVFMFRTPIPSVETDDDCPNLQYAIQNGKLGLEWVLLGERNVADKKAIEKIIRNNGHEVQVMKMNDVSYLRAEKGDLGSTGLQIVHDFYGVDSQYPMGLLVHGIRLSPGYRSRQ